MQRFVLALYTVALCVSFVGCMSPLASWDAKTMSEEERERVRREFMMPERESPARKTQRSDASIKDQHDVDQHDAKLNTPQAKRDIPADPPPGVDPKLYSDIRKHMLAADPEVLPKLEATLAAIVAQRSGTNENSAKDDGSAKQKTAGQARVAPPRHAIKDPPTIPSPHRVAAKRNAPTTQTAAKPATDRMTASSNPTVAPVGPTEIEVNRSAVKFADHAAPARSTSQPLPAYQSPVHVVRISAEEPIDPQTIDPQKSASANNEEVDAGDNNETERDWREHLQDAIAQLQTKLSDNEIEEKEKKRLAAQLHLLFLMQENRDMALKPVSGLSTEEQEFWQEQLFAIDVLLKSDSLPDSDHRARLSLHHLRKAVDHLADHGSLEVGGLAFCTDVQGFGRYTQHNRENSFKPDSPVLLYAEVDNFMSREVPTGFETRLQARYQIYDVSGRRVAEHSFPVLNEVCTNRRRDFFMSFLMYMPQDAPIGEYRLKLIIEDKHAQKFGESDIKFRLKS